MKHSEINWSTFIDFLKQQVGKPYVFGAENKLDENDWSQYKAWDCSELMEVAYYKIGLSLPDGSYNQAKVCPKVVGEILIGDLAFKWNPETEVIHHLGAYIGNNEIVEAKGKAYGVVITPVQTYMASSHFAFFARHKLVENA